MSFLVYLTNSKGENMNTVEEVLANPPQEEMTLHCMDVLKHVLKGKDAATMFGSPVRDDEWDIFKTFREALEARAETDDFDEVVEECYQPKKRWKMRYSESDGDFCVDRYLDNDPRMFESESKELDKTDGLTLILDMICGYDERDSNKMQQRHTKCYTEAMEALSIGRPVRVLGILPLSFPERKKLFVHIVIKDWDDPIFPGIWGVLKNNLTGNCFWNVLCDFLIGTKSGHNGLAIPEKYKLADHFDEGSYISITPTRLS